jgi:large subunit ribosomal protein L3
MKALITRKVGMTSTIADDGVVTAVTLLSASPCVITQVKTVETDGYTAVQIGAETTKHAGKSQAGHLKPAMNTGDAAKTDTFPKIIREFRLGSVDELTEDIKVGEKISADVFVAGDEVNVTGFTKGKGWAGTIRRHNFHRQRATHGGKGNTRKVGSIGSMYPQHIFKGKKMAGQLGHEQVTIRNLKVAFVDMDNNLIGVTGAVPGPRKGIIILKGVN